LQAEACIGDDEVAERVESRDDSVGVGGSISLKCISRMARRKQNTHSFEYIGTHGIEAFPAADKVL